MTRCSDNFLRLSPSFLFRCDSKASLEEQENIILIMLVMMAGESVVGKEEAV
jgi:hypothetical protein